ncbi:hypothetical protein RYX36_036882 [Vicia faba]
MEKRRRGEEHSERRLRSSNVLYPPLHLRCEETGANNNHDYDFVAAAHPRSPRLREAAPHAARPPLTTSCLLSSPNHFHFLSNYSTLSIRVFSLKLFNHFRYCCSSFNWSAFRDSPMAPTRKKGAKKSLATAAASREWKHGDLVLAKVKGFPAWPATVSEPNKWGYSVDRKKIFVLFFGTDQIAFCNPADIEAFTEEKKQSLAKRQGRGADFVRALDEIIECYDKLDRGTQFDETSSGGEVANANVGNPLDPSSNSGFKDQLNSPWTVNSQMKLSNSMTGRPEQVYAVEDDPFG